jgi:ribosomal protein L24E
MSASEKCPWCGRDVKPGTRCMDTACPYEHTVGSDGHMVLYDSLRLRIQWEGKP